MARSLFDFKSPIAIEHEDCITKEKKQALHNIDISPAYYSEYYCEKADGFTFHVKGEGKRKIPLDLVSLRGLFCKDHPKNFPLFVEYVGIAEKLGQRDAIDRLVQGHSSLGKITADLAKKYPDQECFACLYRFNDNFSAIKDFTTTLKTLEATLIQYFKPNSNKQMLHFPTNSNTQLVKDIKAQGIEKIIVSLGTPSNCVFISNSVDYSNYLASNNYQNIELDINFN